jgi:hypothetical protein
MESGFRLAEGLGRASSRPSGDPAESLATCLAAPPASVAASGEIFSAGLGTFADMNNDKSAR